MSTDTKRADFEKQAVHTAYELCEHLTAKSEILLAEASPGLVGATYQICASYILAKVVKILRLNNKADAHIMEVLVKGLNESFRLADMATTPTSKEKH